MSKKAIVVFYRCIQDSQEIGSDDEHMVSRVFFNLQINGEPEGDFYCNLKQTVGSDFLEENIEVSLPDGYKGPLNFDSFSAEAKKYYIGLCGPNGRGISFGPGVKNIRMKNNTFNYTKIVEFDISDAGTAW